MAGGDESTVVDRVQQHVGLLVTLAFFSLVAIRVGAAARGNWTTATVLLSANPVQVASAVLLQLLPVILIQLVCLSLILLSVVSEWRKTATLGAAFFASLLLIAVADAGLVLVSAPILLIGFLGGRRIQMAYELAMAGNPPKGLGRRLRKERSLNTLSVVLILSLGALVGLTLIQGRMWLPPELVSTDDDTYLGYVVQEADWMTIMLHDDRSIVRVKAEDVESRRVCDVQTGRWLTTPLLATALNRDTANYTPCKGKS